MFHVKPFVISDTKIIFLLFVTTLLIWGCDSLETLLSEQKFDEAMEYCKEEDENKSDCFQSVADSLFEQKMYEKAFEYYEKGGHKKEGAQKIAKIFLQQKDYKTAFQYYLKADLKKEGAETIGELFLGEKNYKNAFEFYVEGEIQQDGARKIGAEYIKQGHYKNALSYYVKADLESEGAEILGDLFFKNGYYKKALSYFLVAKQNAKISECREKIKAGTAALEKLDDGIVLAEALPEKYGLTLTNRYIISNSKAGQIQIIDLYTGQKFVMNQNNKSYGVFKNFKLFDDNILFYTLDDSLYSLDFLVGTPEKIKNWSSNISSMSLHKDKNRIALGFWDGSVEILVQTDNQGATGTKNFAASQTIGAHTSPITWLDFSQNGDYLATGSWDNKAKVWDTQTWEDKSLLSHKKPVNQVALSADGKLLVTCAKDKNIKVWSTKNGKAIKTLKKHKKIVNAIAISPDNNYLVSGDFGGVIKIWNLKKKSLIKSIQGHDSSVVAISIAPNSGYFVTYGFDYSMKFWWLADKNSFIEQLGEGNIKK